MAAATHEVGHPTNTGVDNRKLLMWIFLASECLFFGALLSTYLVFKGDLSLPPFPSDTIGSALGPRRRDRGWAR